ncbi:conserved protein of unknown function [Acidithiobacillus ferrivorans]|uniref:CRISPR-associated protein n=1 Tax=Acidithiobacillus ferrivorans TaxID=160808 RepID=A0A060UV41_9PROT|nr:hypothetical protein [Acidithiobacillus ferrivorans]CDQ10638.1 conserved hypothetical protein [Acidithiobacillus ferrivorans]SMH64667.1 conserved protein of unknown function [Acidithiobacillus ferrivorans]
MTLNIGTPYIPPKVAPTLDGLLWGAARLEFPECEDATEHIPLQRTEGVFHGSHMMCDPLFPERTVTFFQSINNEREEDAIHESWLDTRLYKGADVDVSKLRNGDSGRGTFSVKMDSYTPFGRGRFWKAGFFGCGDMSRVESLLRILPGIGRKAARGYGAIADVDVDPVERDCSLMREGKPMRPIPEKLWSSLGGTPLPLRMARAEMRAGHPDDHEVLCVTPGGGRLSW